MNFGEYGAWTSYQAIGEENAGAAAAAAEAAGLGTFWLGVGHPEATSDYRRPLTALEKFLDSVDGAAPPIPVERRIVAALGPKMRATSARRSLGTIPYFTSVDHTRAARAAVGPDALVIPEVAYVLDEDVELSTS